MDLRSSPKMPSSQAKNKQSSPGTVWPPAKCTPLCSLVSGSSVCSNAGRHHELIMTLAKFSNTSEVEKTDFKKSLDKFIKTKWIHTDCVPEKNKEIRFPLVHWACILGKYKALEYLIHDKGFVVTVKIGKNQQGPLHSMVQYLVAGLNPRSSKEYIATMFGYVLDVFLRYIPEILCEKDAPLGDTIVHYLAKRCSSDLYSRMYFQVCLVKLKENTKIKSDKVEQILLAVNNRGDTFLHHLVSDEESIDSLQYFVTHFAWISEKISKAKNNFGKTPRQLAVERRSFKLLRVLGAPAVVIDSLKKVVAADKPSTPKRGQVSKSSTHCLSSKPSPGTNVMLSDRRDHSNPQSIVTEEASDSNTIRDEVMTAEERSSNQTEVSTNKLPEVTNLNVTHVHNDTVEAETNFSDRNVLLSLSDTVNSLSKGDSGANIRKRPAARKSQSKGPSRKRGRVPMKWSDSESDVEDDDDFKLDDDSDDDIESEEDDDVDDDRDKGDDEAAGDVATEDSTNNADVDLILETAPKHTPFCGSACTAQHHKLLLSLLKCSNYNYGAANRDTFMKQVKEFVTQAGNFARLRANADLPDPVASFKYPLVHWVCVLGKFNVLAKLAEMKEFNLAVQSDRTGDTGLHRMLLSLDQGMVLKKSSVKLILEVFSKTLKTLTDCVPKVMTLCNKQGDTPFHCLAKVILDCTGELEKLENTYEGYFERLIKEVTHLKTSGKLTSESVRELLLKTNKSKETFLHILACRVGVGHRVIKSVLKRIEPAIMDVLKEVKDASGKTASDLSEDLHSFEMAAILRPCDHEAPPVHDDDDDDPGEVLQTPVKNTPSESPVVESPPATLFRPMENAISPLVVDHSAACIQLFEVKNEPEDVIMRDFIDFVDEDEKNFSSESQDTSLSTALKQMSERPPSTPSPSHDADVNATGLSADDNKATEDISAASTGNLSNESSSPTHQSNGFSPPMGAVSHGPSTNMPTTLTNVNNDTSLPTINRDYNKVSSAATVSANHSTTSIATSVLASDNRTVSSANQNWDANLPTFEAKSSRNVNGETPRMLGQTDKLLNTLHAKFQEELSQSERGMKQKEEALVHIRHRIEEGLERKQKLLQELEETWNQVMADKIEEGMLQSELVAQKKDCERFKAELAKYATSLKALKK